MAGVERPGSSRDEAAPSTSVPEEAEALWRGILLGIDERYRDGHGMMKRLPGSPRCLFCSAPFKGPGSVVARQMGRRPWPKNPNYCAICFSLLEHQHGGAEINCSLM